MDLQKQVLKIYKENYPQSTLQSIADHTGIQITRVFRLFNGSEMKIREYQIFQKILHKEKFNCELTDLAHECLQRLSKDRNKFIAAQLQHALKLQELKQGITHTHTDRNFSIA